MVARAPRSSCTVHRRWINRRSLISRIHLGQHGERGAQQFSLVRIQGRATDLRQDACPFAHRIERRIGVWNRELGLGRCGGHRCDARLLNQTREHKGRCPLSRLKYPVQGNLMRTSSAALPFAQAAVRNGSFTTFEAREEHWFTICARWQREGRSGSGFPRFRSKAGRRRYRPRSPPM